MLSRYERWMHDQIEATVCSLKSFGIDPNSSYGALLLPLLNENFPSEFRVSIARKFVNNVWDLEEMLKYFKEQQQAKGRCSSVCASEKEKIRSKIFSLRQIFFCNIKLLCIKKLAAFILSIIYLLITFYYIYYSHSTVHKIPLQMSPTSGKTNQAQKKQKRSNKYHILCC